MSNFSDLPDYVQAKLATVCLRARRWAQFRDALMFFAAFFELLVIDRQWGWIVSLCAIVMAALCAGWVSFNGYGGKWSGFALILILPSLLALWFHVWFAAVGVVCLLPSAVFCGFRARRWEKEFEYAVNLVASAIMRY